MVSLLEEQIKTFQFTHPGGVRLGIQGVEDGKVAFQFTHPGGVRLCKN